MRLSPVVLPEIKIGSFQISSAMPLGHSSNHDNRWMNSSDARTSCGSRDYQFTQSVTLTDFHWMKCIASLSGTSPSPSIYSRYNPSMHHWHRRLDSKLIRVLLQFDLGNMLTRDNNQSNKATGHVHFEFACCVRCGSGFCRGGLDGGLTWKTIFEGVC